MLPIRLNWQRPRDGVEVDQEGEVTPDSDLRRFKARSERMEPVTYRVVNLENPIALHFANCVEDTDFAAFFARFGMLDEPGTGDDTWWNMNYVQSVKDDIAEIFDLWRHPNSVEKAQYVNGLVKHVSLRPTFECSPAGANQLMIEPRSLLDLMMMEAIFAVEAGTSLARCAHCSKAYLIGPLTGRRSHSVYCSDRCRVAAMRIRNAAKGEGREEF